MRGIEITFPGVKALDGVDFFLRAGEIHALLGENGAGKSTLIKCLTGVNHKDAGTIILDGKEITPDNPLYQTYVHLWCDLYPVRMGLLKTRAGIGKLIRHVRKG